MNRRLRLQIVMLLLFIFLLFAGVCYAAPVMIEIGDENIWIILKANGPVPRIATYKASGPMGELGVPVIITDPKGRKMGFDPRIGKWLTEFDVSYNVFTQGPVDMTEETEYRYLNDPKFRQEYDEGTDYVLDIAFNLTPGDYIIEAVGERFAGYNLTVLVTHRLKGQPTKSSKIEFNGVIDKNLSSKFKITYNPDPTATPGTGVRIAASSSLKQDITLSRKIGWIDNDGIMKSLLIKADAIEASIAKGNKTTAKNQLNAFINEVRAQSCISESEFVFNCTSGKHISGKVMHMQPSYIKKGGKLVKLPDEEEVNAVKILLEDAKYMMESL